MRGDTSPLRRCRAVLFDLDGTLLDSLDAHYRVYRRVCARMGVAFDEELYRRHYSPNWYLFYERLGLPRDRWAEADRLWLEHYAQETVSPRPGADRALRALRAAGRAVGLVTSGDRSRVERDLIRAGWQGVFDVVVCGGDTAERKPHPAPLRRALARLGVAAEAAAYVGDTLEDVLMGRQAGTVTVAVAGGFAAAEALAASGADVVLPDLDALAALL
ncbi:MAG: HAD family hydrolase [Armatimonadota bacterium]|nr:HAD family hydrolase [Armatimonadota bacterium]MDR7401568.1 HAD family hydrolase [Armatimonadota bacterium]MDR7403309.1 HAD family hydrolase [Armatimonadota bacterium]MDR7436835.1 HAD family hydrolase [Armatimonadota bacterium]MDR7471624.1 HAD family hydrolase [Armatimonadota bacterium]